MIVKIFIALVRYAKEEHVCENCGRHTTTGEEIFSVLIGESDDTVFFCGPECLGEFLCKLPSCDLYTTDEVVGILRTTPA